MRSSFVFGFAFITAINAEQATAQNLPNLTEIASLKGTCERLVMAGNNLSKGCGGTIVQSIYSTGRTGFTVLVGDKGTAVTFSGIEGEKPDADSQLQSVDMVILNLNIQGVAPTSTKASGSCAYSNPFNGPMTISCQAVDGDKKAYLLQFRTDGNEPVMTDLRKPAAEPGAEGSGRNFSLGPWVGSPLRNDPEHGCLMLMKINQKISLMLYANGNEAFTISFHNENWNFNTDAKIDADLLFDGTSFPISGVEVRNSKVLTIQGGSEEDGLETPFKESGELLFRMGREQIKAKLTKSRAAAEQLWSCVEKNGK